MFTLGNGGNLRCDLNPACAPPICVGVQAREEHDVKRPTTALAVVLAAGLMLAGCSSGSTDTASSTSSVASSASSSAASAETTTSATSSSSSSAEPMDSAGATAAPTLTAGDGSGELDAQTTTWFSTFCTGLAGVADLQTISSAQQASQVLQRVGTDMTNTASQLAALAPPTFSGGDGLAASAVNSFNQIGPAFVSFGQRAGTIGENDEAATQQFAADFQAQLAPLASLTKIQLDPATQQAVSAIPECNQVMNAVGGSGAPATTS